MKTTAPPEQTANHDPARSFPVPDPVPPLAESRPHIGSIGRLGWSRVGLLLLGLYVLLLARNDLAKGLPGGALGPVFGCMLALAVVGIWRARQRGLSLGAVAHWLLRHVGLVTIIGITVAAGLVRLLGIGFGLPYLDHPDEPAVADRALHILQSGDFNPHYFVYPNLYTYLEAGVFLVRFFSLVSSGAIGSLDAIVPIDFYLWGRLLTAALGTLTVPLVYAAGQRLYGMAVGLIAAVFVAGNSLHLQQSQFIATDVPAGFFSALALLAIVRLLPERPDEDSWPLRTPPGFGAYLAVGVGMGLAIGAKYNSALIVLPFLLAHGYVVTAQPGAWWRQFWGTRFWVALTALALTFFLTTPFAVFDLPHFLDDLASVITHYSTGHLGFESDHNWRVYVPEFLHTDLGPTALTLIGVALAFLRPRRVAILLVAFPLAFYFTMSNYRVNFPHNFLPILPFTAILAADALVRVWQAVANWAARRRAAWAFSNRARRAGLIALTAVAVWPATAEAIRHNWVQAQPDTRTLVSQWLDAHAAPGSKIWMEPPNLVLTPGRYLTDSGDHVTMHPAAWYNANRFDYLIVTDNGYKDVFDHPERDPALHAAYKQFFEENAARQVVAFAGKRDNPGPGIRVYRSSYAPPTTAADVHTQHPLNATFHSNTGTPGGQVRLLGADYPPTLTVGSALPLVLYWATDQPLPADYTEFVHLMNRAGDRVAQRDTAPRSGTAPTSGWHTGEIVVDEAPLTLPASLPPGVYTVRVGLYLQSNGAALVVQGAPGDCPVCVVLGPIQVQSAKP